MQIKESLINAITHASGLESSQVDQFLTVPKEKDHGDLAFPCFALAKTWKSSPPDCAIKLKNVLKLPEGISQVDVVGPYLNFKYDREFYCRSVLSDILKQGPNYAVSPKRGEKVVIEYSAPNIAKTFHVGHMRTTLIGHSLVQIYKRCGFEVVGINHLGDWGTQFGFCWAGCQLWGKPDKISVDALAELYQRASTLKKQQEAGTVPEQDRDKPTANQMARDYFIKLEAGEKDAVAFWQWCLDLSLDHFREVYKRLGIEFDYYTGESFYRDQLPAVEAWLKKSGILEDSRGALGVDLGKALGFVRVFAEDGRSLYITRDIACALYRYEHFKPQANIYVVAAQQQLHFKQLIAVLRAAKHPAAEIIKHVSFGFVPGMSTRQGSAVSLEHYLNEAHSRALSTYRTQVTKRPADVDEEQVAEKVAIGATYFYFLSHSNIKDFQFSWEAALNFQGDSGPYLQYAVARINSIEARAKAENVTLTGEFDPAHLSADHAFHLVSLLGMLPERISSARQENEPYYIAHYLLDLAKQFSKAYLDLKVIGEEPAKAASHLALFKATRTVLQIGFNLLGIPEIERM